MQSWKFVKDGHVKERKWNAATDERTDGQTNGHWIALNRAFYIYFTFYQGCILSIAIGTFYLPLELHVHLLSSLSVQLNVSYRIVFLEQIKQDQIVLVKIHRYPSELIKRATL